MTLPVPHAGLEYILARIIQEFMQFMRQRGLSMPQINALMHIYHSGQCQLSDIGALTDSSKPAASQLVERLVCQGLVERSEDPLDRRIKILRLTAKSLDMIQNGVLSNPFLAELLASLPPDQLESIHSAFGYLAQAGQQIQAAHMENKNA
jgi:DNA-binding MarR family transcriptional regulator